ncbi:MAG: aldose epimerase family protein [Flagellimonas sp.]
MNGIIRLLFIVMVFQYSMGQYEAIDLIPTSNFKQVIDGKEVKLFTLKNANGLVSQITNYGGRVVSLWVPDKNGVFEDVVLGYDTLEGYLNSSEKYFGALIGRYGNRIGKGQFTLNGREYKLDTNDGKNHLHGGSKGFDSVVWDVTDVNENMIEFQYTSPHMEAGYPGTLKVTVQYRLTNKNDLEVEYWANTDKQTVINLTHHSFFNLNGHGTGTINDHLLQINASFFTPVDNTLIPEGTITTVEETPFDFRQMIAIGQRLDEDNLQLRRGNGYDHNFVLNQSLEGLNYAAKVEDPNSGRVMEVYTNEPGLQFYGGNFLDGTIRGKQGKIYEYRSAFCLETQHFPDSPNNTDFPSTVLLPNEQYHSICIYKFSTIK